MNVVFDPIVPWSRLKDFLTAAPPAVVVAAWGAGAVAFLLPILLHVRPRGASPRRLVSEAGVVLAVLFGVVVLANPVSNGGAAAGLQGMGWVVGLLMAPLALAGLTAWTYLGVPGATRRRVGWVLGLRLAAWLLALLAVLRPAIAFSERSRVRTVLVIAADASESMTIRDETDNQSRWELLLRSLRESAPALERLREQHGIEVAFRRFAADVAPFDPDAPGQADGRRTDVGGMLHQLHETREAQVPLLGLLVLSDGADNGGARNPVRTEAQRWRRLPCPVHAFACGQPTTSDRQSDVALRTIAVSPAPVPVKSKMTVKLTLDAPGFESSVVRLRLFLDGKEVAARNVPLPLTQGNEVLLQCTAPATAGEIKVRVQVEDPRHEGQAPPGDLIATNNTIETFATVSKEGISVLLVDRQRAWEPQLICDALAGEPRIRVTPVWLRGDRPVDGDAGDLFQFDENQYDVIILGDVTARQVRAVNPKALATIEKLVASGAGLLMIGGYASFGNSDWRGTPIEQLLPVDLSVRGQVETPVEVVPTEAGLRQYGYFMRASGTKDEKAAWRRLRKLKGMTLLGRKAGGLDRVLAESASGEPVLVAQDYGRGRVLAFGGDTTYVWVRNPEGLRMHTRFWRNMIVWLARQENAEGSVRVEPQVRRLPVRSDLAFRVSVRSKAGLELPGATYRARVMGPGGVTMPVRIVRGPDGDHGVFTKTDAAGEYRILVHGEAKVGGEEIKDNGTARFLVYDENLEMARPAADHDFLKELAAEGGGTFRRVEELPRFLEQLAAEAQARERATLERWPNWRARPRPPFILGYLLAFAALLAGEWFLRRRWGMV